MFSAVVKQKYEKIFVKEKNFMLYLLKRECCEVFMTEYVMTVPAKLLKDVFGENAQRLICTDEKSFIDFVESHAEYIERGVAEEDESKKQIIAYLLIRYGDEVFMTRRLKAQSEARLHDRRSVGIGGHINTTDGSKNPVLLGLKRELCEEVFIPENYKMKFLGIINDDSTSVGKVHTGLCYEIVLPSPNCKVLETEKMVGEWANEEKIKEVFESFENWSKIVLNTVFNY